MREVLKEAATNSKLFSDINKITVNCNKIINLYQRLLDAISGESGKWVDVDELRDRLNKKVRITCINIDKLNQNYHFLDRYYDYKKDTVAAFLMCSDVLEKLNRAIYNIESEEKNLETV